MAVIEELRGLTGAQRDLLLQQVDAVPNLAQGMLVALQEECLARCADDGLFFLQFVRTRDEADPKSPVKSFPVYLPYVKPIWELLVREQLVAVAKSRQMLMSWIICIFCVWWARFKPNQAIYWQTQKAEDAYEKVSLPKGTKSGTGYLGRCHFIETHLPTWLQQPDIQFSEGRVNYPDGSMIQAIPGGADQIRGKVPTIIVEDEFAFQEEALGVYTAAAPLIQKGAKFIAVSTPNGSSNMFARLFHGFPLK